MRQHELILNDVKTMNFDTTCYPTVEEMTDNNAQLNMVPTSLKLLLKPLVKTDERVAAWGQAMVKLIRPQSGSLPSSLALSI